MTEPLDHLIAAYARLLVRVGVNVQLGQRVLVRCEVEHAPVAQVVAAEAYRAGASRVDVEYVDARVQRAAVEHAPQDRLGEVLPHQLEAARALGEDGAAVIRLTGNPNPGLMDGLAPERLSASVPKALIGELMALTSSNRIAWTVAGAPNPGWAQAVLGEPDVERLWRAVAVATRLDEEDPVRSWRDHLDALALRRDLLDERRFDRIRFRGPGTDLEVGLSPLSRWQGGEQIGPNGVPFVPNVPTEEVFTSPDWRRAEGRMRTTAAFYLSATGALVEGLELELHDGTVTGARADRGEEHVHLQLDSVPRARHLGEVAIVDGGSRVRRTGLVYNDMLYDENVGCHVAWGSGFTTTFEGAQALRPDERVKAGLNQSPTHVDVVVGSAQVEVDGIDAHGHAVPLLRGDEFVLR